MEWGPVVWAGQMGISLGVTGTNRSTTPRHPAEFRDRGSVATVTRVRWERFLRRLKRRRQRWRTEARRGENRCKRTAQRRDDRIDVPIPDENGAIIYPFHIILRSTPLTSVGRRSYRRHIAVAISCGLGVYPFHIILRSTPLASVGRRSHRRLQFVATGRKRSQGRVFL